MASTINASNSGFGGIVSTGDSSGQLQLQTANTTAVTIDTSQNVGIGTTSPSALLNVSNASAKIRIGLDASSQYLDIYRDNATGYSIYNAAQATPYRAHIWQLGGTEAMRIDTSGNVGLNNSNPAQYDTSGKVLNISGSSIVTPSVLFMAGNGTGAGYSATEVFAVSGVTAATEITRNTGTGANGFRAYIKITVTGHTGGIGNGINIKEYYWDGGTGAPVQISTYTNGSVPVISFDNSTNNVWIVKLASSNGTSSFNGVMQVEWLMPIDFSSATWTIS
jgi:hypothetical protein